MGKVKEHREIVLNVLILMFSNFGMDCPSNIEEITDFVANDVLETADPEDWHSGDVSIGFRRWIEAQAKPDECTNTNEGIVRPENIQPIWSEVKAEHEDEDKIYVDAWLSEDENENGTVIAKIDLVAKNVVYFDDRAKTDKYAQEVINERLKDI